jgi:uncharacterized protein (DUF433 family)
MKKVISKKDNFVSGSKVPVSYLIDYLKEGYNITDFLSSYPWIKRAVVEKLLVELKKHHQIGI